MFHRDLRVNILLAFSECGQLHSFDFKVDSIFESIPDDGAVLSRPFRRKTPFYQAMVFESIWCFQYEADVISLFLYFKVLIWESIGRRVEIVSLYASLVFDFDLWV